MLWRRSGLLVALLREIGFRGILLRGSPRTGVQPLPGVLPVTRSSSLVRN